MRSEAGDSIAATLVEREGPLSALRAAAGQAALGRGSVVIVGGEAGIGKTSLLRAVGDWAAGDHLVLWGGCEALVTPRPLGPLCDMAEALDPALTPLLDAGAPPAKLFPAVLRSLQERPGGVTLIFEDVHWADHATLDLIRYLGRRIIALRALLILSLREDELSPHHPSRQAIGDLSGGATLRINLEPLSEMGVAALAEASGRPPGDLHRVTKGNPFFVTELLHRDNPSAAALPVSVRDAIWARLSRLADPDLAVLDVLSVVPGGVEAWLVAKLLDREPEIAALRGLVERDGQGHYMFRHELVRLAVLERLSPLTQKALHARILAVMIGAGGMPLSRLVHHAAGAEDAAQVLELAPEAAAEAARLGAHQQAAAHLATALRFAGRAPPALAAGLHENWSYEAGLALRIDDEIIAARHRAIALWREAGRLDKVGHNLRWLSRLHWYLGQAKEAHDYIDQAIAVLEAIEPGPELAMGYSARSQLHMLNDRTDEAIDWGKRAIALAERYGEVETRVHALNNVGSALLLSGREGGHAFMEESLALALEHGLHEQAARAYTNFAEYAVLFRDFPLAERLLAEGIAFDTRHDLDAWTHYLVGRQAQLRMDQGRLREAETVAKGVLALDRLTLLMRLPALTVLGKVHARLGEADAADLLRKALADAEATGEQQYIAPARLGLAEAAWLANDLEACREELRKVAELQVRGFDPWELGDFAVWWRRAGMAPAFPAPGAVLAKPRQAELAGDFTGAAAEWQCLGLSYEAGLTLLVSSDGAALARAVELFQSIEAKPAEAMARRLGREAGIEHLLPRRRRGPYSASRAHPLGLTGREVEILGCIAEGMSNHDIARRMARSQRTVEHHVSAVLAKLNATNRLDALLRLRGEPWLIPEK